MKSFFLPECCLCLVGVDDFGVNLAAGVDFEQVDFTGLHLAINRVAKDC